MAFSKHQLASTTMALSKHQLRSESRATLKKKVSGRTGSQLQPLGSSVAAGKTEPGPSASGTWGLSRWTATQVPRGVC